MKTVRKDEPERIGTADELAPKQETAAVALAGGATFDEAAKAARAGVTTVKTWATVPAFRQRVNELRAELSARVLGRIAKGMMTAIETLERLSRSGKTEATQLKASEALLTHGTTLTEVAELKARMDQFDRGNGR